MAFPGGFGSSPVRIITDREIDMEVFFSGRYTGHGEGNRRAGLALRSKRTVRRDRHASHTEALCGGLCARHEADARCNRGRGQGWNGIPSIHDRVPCVFGFSMSAPRGETYGDAHTDVWIYRTCVCPGRRTAERMRPPLVTR